MYSYYVSQIADGSMKYDDRTWDKPFDARKKFLKKFDILMHDTTLIDLDYTGKDYARYKIVSDEDKGDGIIRGATNACDALVTTKSDHALFLPLADCIGAVIHDPKKNILMLSHLGRHNLEQFGGIKSIEFLVENFHCDPKNLIVWLSPAAGKDNYPLFAFADRGMHEVATEQLLFAGIMPDNLTSSEIDTTKDTSYFSHSEFLKGNRDTDGRFAIVAVMK